jgi:hypothetical protein
MPKRNLALSSLLLLMWIGPPGARPVTVLPSGRGEGTSCTYGRWSGIRLIDPRGSVLSTTRFPSLAVSPNVDYVVGAVGSEAPKVAGLAGERVWPPRLRAHVLGAGRPAPELSGGFWFIHPRAVADAEGRLHVLWAEPDTPPQSAFATADLKHRHVWYARLTSAGWSRPATVYSARELNWETASTSEVRTDRRGLLYFAFIVEDSVGTAIVVIRHGRDSASGVAWDHVLVRPRWPPVYVDLTVAQSGSVSLVYAAAGTPRGGVGRSNVLYLQSGPFETLGTSAPRELAFSDSAPSFEPRVAMAKGGGVHLVWLRLPDVASASPAIEYALLDASGMATRRATLALSVTPARLRFAVDVCETAHVIFESYSRDQQAIRYARVENGRWSAVQGKIGTGQGSQPSLRVDGNRLRAAWNVAPEFEVPGSLPTSGLFVAELGIRQ